MEKVQVFSMHMGRGIEQGRYPEWVVVYERPVVYEYYADAKQVLQERVNEEVKKLEDAGLDYQFVGEVGTEPVEIISDGKVVFEGGIQPIDFVKHNDEKPW